MGRQRPLTAGAVLLAVAALSTGCGGGNTKADAILGAQTGNGRPLSAEDALVTRKLVTGKDVAAFPAGSVQRAFAEYWSALGNEEWSVAVNFYSASIRRVLDAQYLVPALRIEAQNNLPVKPLVREVQSARGQTAVRFFVRTGDGKLRPTSLTWQKSDGQWYIVYSPTLDDSYRAAVQQAVQEQIAPTARKADPTAIRAGAKAARQQAETLAIKP